MPHKIKCDMDLMFCLAFGSFSKASSWDPTTHVQAWCTTRGNLVQHVDNEI